MDSVVAQYSRNEFDHEGYSQEEQNDLYDIAPTFSTKFAMPPVASVRSNHSQLLSAIQIAYNSTLQHIQKLTIHLACPVATNHDRRLLKPQLSHQDRTRNDDTSIPIPRRYNRSDGFTSDGWKLDCESDGQEGYRD